MKKFLFILMSFIIAEIFISCNFGNNSDSNPSSVLPPVVPPAVPKRTEIFFDIPADKAGKEIFLVKTNIGTTNLSQSDTGLINTKNQIVKDDFRLETLYDGKYIERPFNPSCDLVPVKGPKNPSLIYKNDDGGEPSVGDKRDFITVNDKDEYDNEECKDSVLVKIGNHCNVWYKERLDNTGNPAYTIEDEIFETVKTTFDSLYEIENNIFGNNYGNYHYNNIIDTSDSTKIDIVIYDVFDDYKKSATGGTFGYFARRNFFNKVKNSDGEYVDDPYSNKCEVIFIDSFFLCNQANVISGVDADGALYFHKKTLSTLAHEYQHLLNYVNKSLIHDNADLDSWCTEMLSMTCEDIMQNSLFESLFASEGGFPDDFTPKTRFSKFDTSANSGFEIWRSGDDVMISYANAYAFGAYLLRNWGGVKLIHEIATNGYSDREAITQALKTLGYSEDFNSVLAKFGETFINTSKSGITFNKGNNSDTFNGTTYSYTPIDILSDNYSRFSIPTSNEEVFYLADVPKTEGGRLLRRDTTDPENPYSVILGPRIFNNGCYVINLANTGTEVMHIGKDLTSVTILSQPNIIYTLVYSD